MQLMIQEQLPFITLTVTYRNETIDVPQVLLDTGSAGTILSADWMIKLGIEPEPSDILHTIRGVGGTEVVFTRRVDSVQIEDRQVKDFLIEIGGMDYGIALNGILGMDFLIQTGAVINLNTGQLTFEL